MEWSGVEGRGGEGREGREGFVQGEVGMANKNIARGVSTATIAEKPIGWANDCRKNRANEQDISEKLGTNYTRT